MRVPDQVRKAIREKLWSAADELGWHTLTWVEKSPLYEVWTKDPHIGGLLSHHMDQRQIRVYLKDTLMKGYVRARQADYTIVCRVAGIENVGEKILESYQRPHGLRLSDGKLLCWGSADEWKLILMALHERAYLCPGAPPLAAIFLHAEGKFHQPDTREMVEAAAHKLGIQTVFWVPGAAR